MVITLQKRALPTFNALHEALGGAGDAVLIAHDWVLLLPMALWQQNQIAGVAPR